MIVQLGPIIDSLADIFASVWMVFLRVGALVAVLPGFGEQSVPMRIRHCDKRCRAFDDYSA